MISHPFHRWHSEVKTFSNLYLQAFTEMQVNKIETSKKLKMIELQAEMLKTSKKKYDITDKEVTNLASDTRYKMQILTGHFQVTAMGGN